MDDKIFNNLTEEQLNLLINNCNVYKVSNDIKQKYIDRLKVLKNNQ